MPVEPSVLAENGNLLRQQPLLLSVPFVASGICAGWYAPVASCTWAGAVAAGGIAILLAALAARRWHGLRGVCLSSILFVLFAASAWRVSDERAGLQVAWPEKEAAYMGDVVRVVKERGDLLTADVRLLRDASHSAPTVRLYLRGYSLESRTGDWESQTFVSRKGHTLQRYQRAVRQDADTLTARALRAGDRLMFVAHIAMPDAPKADNDFDYATYLLQHGVSGHAYVEDAAWQRLDAARTPTLRERFLHLRDTLTARLHHDFPASTSSLLSALTLGERRALSPTLREQFSAVGVSHILALSGLHLGILFSLWIYAVRLLTRDPRIRRWASWCALPLIWGFVLLADTPFSLVRAATMLTLFLVFTSWRKYSAPMNGIILAFLTMLCVEPMALFDVGFQLSFAAITSIFLFERYVWSLLFVQPEQGLIAWIWSPLRITLSAQIGTLPLVAYHFHRVAATSLWASPLAVGLLYFILALALIYFLFPALPFLTPALAGLIAALTALVDAAASLPYATLTWAPDAVSATCLYLALFALLYFLSRRTPRRLYLFTLAVAALLLWEIWKTW